MNASNDILFDIDHRGVATISLNRPERHNAFDDDLIAQLTECFVQAGADESVKAVVLTSTGKSFCAGADLNWMKRMAQYSYEQNEQDANQLATMLHTLNTLPKITIARVQGAAFGGAIGLIACCDMAVGTKLSRFCLSEVKIGLIPATISPYVIDAIGPRIARRYFLSAEVFSAKRARRIGLLSEAVSEEELDATVNQMLEATLANGPQAVAKAKALISDVQYRPKDAALREDMSSRIAQIRVSEEGQEGLSAFLQKRSAAWKQGAK